MQSFSSTPKTPRVAASDLERDILRVAHRLADIAAVAILPRFRRISAVESKGDSNFDPVTAADRDAETAIRQELARLRPADGIIGEEFGPERPDAEHVWIIDPIDGTRAFIMGWPLWGTLIGWSNQGRPTVGMMNQPFTRERFWGGGSGAYVRVADETAALRTRSCPEIGQAIVTTTSPDLLSAGAERERFDELSGQARMRRYGGDCYAYCMLAAGHTDLVVETGLKSYDIAPLIPIVEAAGGCVTTWDGGDASQGGRIVAAGDRRLHDRAVAMLSAG